MKKLFFFALAGIILSACSNSGNKTQTGDQAGSKEIVITNDMENAMGVIPSWVNEKTVTAMKEVPAHSGGYASVTDDSIQFSYTYQEKLANINSGVPKIVTMSGWLYTTVANPVPSLSIVCSIHNNDSLISWKVYPLEKEMAVPGKWVEFSSSFYIDDIPLKPEYTIKLYAWNQSKKKIYIDDLKITMSY